MNIFFNEHFVYFLSGQLRIDYRRINILFVFCFMRLGISQSLIDSIHFSYSPLFIYFAVLLSVVVSSSCRTSSLWWEDGLFLPFFGFWFGFWFGFFCCFICKTCKGCCFVVFCFVLFFWSACCIAQRRLYLCNSYGGSNNTKSNNTFSQPVDLCDPRCGSMVTLNEETEESHAQNPHPIDTHKQHPSHNIHIKQKSRGHSMSCQLLLLQFAFYLQPLWCKNLIKLQAKHKNSTISKSTESAKKENGILFYLWLTKN